MRLTRSNKPVRFPVSPNPNVLMKKQFTIKIQKEARSRIGEVAKQIRAIGARIDSTMSTIGVISATMDEALESQVRVVTDVETIREAKIYHTFPQPKPLTQSKA